MKVSGGNVSRMRGAADCIGTSGVSRSYTKAERSGTGMLYSGSGGPCDAALIMSCGAHKISHKRKGSTSLTWTAGIRHSGNTSQREYVTAGIRHSGNTSQREAPSRKAGGETEDARRTMPAMNYENVHCRFAHRTTNKTVAAAPKTGRRYGQTTPSCLGVVGILARRGLKGGLGCLPGSDGGPPGESLLGF
jgi:hypothetical protein